MHKIWVYFVNLQKLIKCFNPLARYRAFLIIFNSLLRLKDNWKRKCYIHKGLVLKNYMFVIYLIKSWNKYANLIISKWKLMEIGIAITYGNTICNIQKYKLTLYRIYLHVYKERKILSTLLLKINKTETEYLFGGHQLSKDIINEYIPDILQS